MLAVLLTLPPGSAGVKACGRVSGDLHTVGGVNAVKGDIIIKEIYIYFFLWTLLSHDPGVASAMRSARELLRSGSPR